MRVLVTGAQGFIGRYTVAAALHAGAESVCGFGRSQQSHTTFTHEITIRGVARPALLPEPLQNELKDQRYSYYSCEINDASGLNSVIAITRPEVIIHLASTRREEGAARLIDGNIHGIRTLIDVCAGRGIQRIVFGSSGGVYGIPDHLPISEGAPCRPVDLNGASKLASEHFGAILCGQAGIELVTARIFNVVGPGQDERHLCGRLAREAASIEADLMPPEVGAGGLDATRDYIDVRDVAAALFWLAEHGAAGETYNVGSGVETSVHEVIEATLQAIKLPTRVQIVRLNSASRVPRHFADIQRLVNLGFQPRIPLQSSLAEVVAYYQTHMAVGVHP